MQQVLPKEPALAYAKEKLVGGLHLPNDETGDCYLFSQALAEKAKALGVIFCLITKWSNWSSKVAISKA